MKNCARMHFLIFFDIKSFRVQLKVRYALNKILKGEIKMFNNQNLNNKLGNAVINSASIQRLAYNDLKTDIYNEYTVNETLTAHIKIPTFNIAIVVAKVLENHEYALAILNHLSAIEITDLLQHNPEYLVMMIHESTVIEEAITEALVQVTHNNFFRHMDYILTHADNIGMNNLYTAYHKLVFTPIITALGKFSQSYLQLKLLEKTAF